MMFEKVVVPLLVAENLKEVRGKTRFQKLVCLIQDKALKAGVRDLDYKYELYYHGPFSVELASIVEELVQKDYLAASVVKTPAGNILHTYVITPIGRTFLKRALGKEIVSSKLKSIVKEVSSIHGYRPLPQLVEEAYKAFSSN